VKTLILLKKESTTETVLIRSIKTHSSFQVLFQSTKRSLRREQGEEIISKEWMKKKIMKEK